MQHSRALLLLLVLVLVYFHELVLHPGQILYSDHSDLIAEHIPAKRFLVRSIRETGELPLWCPHLFAGSPFVHDIQVAMFYPPHLALHLLPEEAIGPALSWIVVLHVLLAGWLMYGYAIHRGLSGASSFVAAVGFMFGGRWLMHLLGGGHYILIGLAWLPLVLLGWERAMQPRRLGWAVLAGAAFALLTLGTQPQWTFYSGLFAALWTLGVVQTATEGRRGCLLRWLGTGLLVVTMTLGLTAIQLLPTLEAAGQSSRAGGVGFEGILEGGMRVLLFLVGPALSDDPFNLKWEDRGGLALTWLSVGVWAPVLRGGRTRYEAWICLGLFLFAMGGAILFQPLPGFSLFRQPARMAVVAMLPVAFLAAIAVQALSAPEGLTDEQRTACQRWLIRLTVAVVLLAGGFALRLRLIEGKPLSRGFGPMYFPIAGTLVVFAWLLLRQKNPRNSQREWSWAILLGFDLLCLNTGLAGTCDPAVVESVPASVRFTAKQPHTAGRVLDLDQADGACALGNGAALAPVLALDAVRGYSPLDVRSYREYLLMIGDRDEPLRALSSTASYPVIGNIPLVNRPLLDLLNVRYLIGPVSEPAPREGWRKVMEDEGGLVYDFIAGGRRRLERTAVWENTRRLQRAFVVPQAQPLPERSQVLETLKKTDFREVVYLEDFKEEPQTKPLGWRTPEVEFLAYEPNRIQLAVRDGSAGFLFLGDVWYPGWTCTVNGEQAQVHRANYTFRAVQLPAGDCEVVLRFEPRSYALGKRITFVSLGVAVGLVLLLVAAKIHRKYLCKPQTLPLK